MGFAPTQMSQRGVPPSVDNLVLPKVGLVGFGGAGGAGVVPPGVGGAGGCGVGGGVPLPLLMVDC